MFRVGLLAVVVCLGRAAHLQDSTSPQELLKAAIEAQQAGHNQEAIKDYREILKNYPQVFAVRSNLGAALAGEGRYAEAISEYERALELQPNPQVKLNLALAYYKLANYQAAAERLAALHRELPDNSQVITVLADSELRLGHNKAVITLLTPFQRAEASNQTYSYLLGTALIRDNQVAKGQVVIDQILRNGDSPECHLLMGLVKFQSSEFAGARDDFAKALALDPRLPEGQAYYGMALLSTGDQAGARKAFTTELASDPNNFVANLNMGVLLRQDESYGDAMKYLRQALLIRPADPGVRFQMASIEMSEGKLKEATQDLESLVKDSPQFIEAHVALATVYFREKRKTDGERERATYAKLNAEREAKNELAAQPAQ